MHNNDTMAANMSLTISENNVWHLSCRSLSIINLKNENRINVNNFWHCSCCESDDWTLTIKHNILIKEHFQSAAFIFPVMKCLYII